MRVCFGCLQNSNHACFNKPLFFNALIFSVISVGEMSMCNGSYTLRLFRCTIALLMYSSLSIIEPLSALFITIRGLLISSLRANLSFLVRLSCLSCLCLSVFSISILTLCRKVSRVPLSDNLSGS